jgi:hypothetical protein
MAQISVILIDKDGKPVGTEENPLFVVASGDDT